MTEYDERRRNWLICIEYAQGEKTLDQVGRPFGISGKRIHQIYFATLCRLGLPRNATATDIGLAIQRRTMRERREEQWRAGGARNASDPFRNTPEWMYAVISDERRRAEAEWYYGESD